MPYSWLLLLKNKSLVFTDKLTFWNFYFFSVKDSPCSKFCSACYLWEQYIINYKINAFLTHSFSNDTCIVFNIWLIALKQGAGIASNALPRTASEVDRHLKMKVLKHLKTFLYLFVVMTRQLFPKCYLFIASVCEKMFLWSWLTVWPLSNCIPHWKMSVLEWNLLKNIFLMSYWMLFFSKFSSGRNSDIFC